jgi:aryl sulfotransferase
MSQVGQIAWPVKTREMHNHHMNSTVWNNFRFRDDDIVIASYGKSGTTWIQQIIAQLLFDGVEGMNVSPLSPWVDLRAMPPPAIAALDQQTHRRFVKTHLPIDALVFSPQAKYLYVVRDGRDTVWSLYNHHVNANAIWYDAMNNTPGRVGPPIEPPPASVREYFLRWLNEDGYPFWSPWEHTRSWWEVRHLPNVKLVHFNDMKGDLAGSIRGIADFLGIRPDDDCFTRIVEHCTFDYMKAHAETVTPLGGVMWNGGAQTFINKGTNGRWRDVLTAEDVAAYEARALAELGPECAAWLASGTAVR